MQPSKHLLETLVLGTHNRGKIRELSEILAPYVGKILTANDFDDLPEVKETGSTMQENAELKATAIMKATGLPTLSEDSGIFFDALEDGPGIYAKRWSQKYGGFPACFEPLKAAVDETGLTAGAYKVCAVLLFPDGDKIVTFGETKGSLRFPPVTSDNGIGFGFDPVFVPAGYDAPFAALPKNVKMTESHRARAIHALIAKLTAAKAA